MRRKETAKRWRVVVGGVAIHVHVMFTHLIFKQD